jgi:hypothetical protein
MGIRVDEARSAHLDDLAVLLMHKHLRSMDILAHATT